MQPRPSLPLGRSLLLLSCVALLAAAAGCQTTLATAIWLVQGPDIPAEYKGLSGKRVAVVCRPLVGLTYRDSSAARDVAREMTKLLRQNVRKIEIIDQREVAEWVDEHDWEEFTEVGEALDADLVVGVDLESFSIFQGQTVYQGKANVDLKVYDCATGEAVFERQPPQVVYPPNSARSAADQQESDFRREYVRVLADQLARHFYPHDPRAYFAMDAANFH